MAKRDWQQSTGFEAVVITGYNTLAGSEKYSQLGSEENLKRLKLTDAAEYRGSQGQISTQSVVIMDTHMEDLEQKRHDEQVKRSNPDPEELYFYKFF